MKNDRTHINCEAQKPNRPLFSALRQALANGELAPAAGPVLRRRSLVVEESGLTWEEMARLGADPAGKSRRRSG